PLILATTAIGPVRGPYWVSVPDARGPLAVQLLGYEELAEHESCCFKLREIEKLSLASARPIYERRQDGRRASQPADSIRGGNGRIERLLAGVAQERRQPDHRFGRRTVSDVIAVRPCCAVARHGQINQARIEFAQPRIIKLELRHDARAKIFNQHVRTRRQPSQQIAPSGQVEINANAELVAIQLYRSRRGDRRRDGRKRRL